MLLNSIPPPESSFGTLRMPLEKNNSMWRSNHSDLRFVFDSEEIRLVPLRLDLDLSRGLLQVKYLFRPRHISTWQSRTTVGSAIACHSIGSTVRSAHYLSCKILHTMEVKHVISRLSHHATQVQNMSTCELSLSQLSPLSACPADLLAYVGLVLYIVSTPASLSFSPTLRLNATIELSPTVRMITSAKPNPKNPLGWCLNWKFVFNSFAAHTVCMNHFASLVPNHEYGCGAHCYCLCFSKLSSLIISAL